MIIFKSIGTHIRTPLLSLFVFLLVFFLFVFASVHRSRVVAPVKFVAISKSSIIIIIIFALFCTLPSVAKGPLIKESKSVEIV